MADNEKNIFAQQESQAKLQSLSDSVGFEIPVESITLPSQGIIYSTDHPLCNAECVDIKTLSCREEDILTSKALIKNGTVITKLLESCILNKSVNPDLLLIGDRNAILIGIRVSGYGASYNVQIECSDCEHKFDNIFDLSKLNVKPLGASPLQPNTNLFDFVLPISGLSVQFKLMTGMDEQNISRELDAKKKAVKSLIDNTVTTRLFHSVVSIGGETSKEKLVRMISNLRAGDARALRNYIQQIEPGVEMKQMVKCPACGVEMEVDIPLGIGFLYPDIK